MVSLSNFPNLNVVSFMSPEGLIKHLTTGCMPFWCDVGIHFGCWPVISLMPILLYIMQMLPAAIHECTSCFPDVLGSVLALGAFYNIEYILRFAGDVGTNIHPFFGCRKSNLCFVHRMWTCCAPVTFLPTSLDHSRRVSPVWHIVKPSTAQELLCRACFYASCMPPAHLLNQKLPSCVGP